jgi:mannose-6-phosphate isomerase
MPITGALSTVPHRVGPNKVPVYYAGGEGIDRFRGEPGTEGPEDWVGSVTRFPPALLPAGADPRTGVTRLADGTLLDSALGSDAVGWLGADLSRLFGREPGLLVKLLDAGERLPVHCHPGRTFAAEHLKSRFGKNEGWIVLAAKPESQIWLGFSRDVDSEELRGWVEKQDVEAMLAALNVFRPDVGDVYYVPAGVPHAIGTGVTIIEVQEPTSFSVLAEYRSFGVDESAATLGLGWDLALSCFDLHAYTGEMRRVLLPEPVTTNQASGSLTRLYDTTSEPFFQAYRADAAGSVVRIGGPQFRVLIVEEGAGMLLYGDATEAVARGETWVVPHGAGELALEGAVTAVVCCPPAV